MSKRLSGNRPRRLSAGKFSSRISAVAVSLLLITAVYGCFSSVIVNSRKQFYAGKTPAAIKTLSKITEKGGKDRILVLMDYGLELHVAGNYRESADALLEANKLIEENDVIRVGQKAGSMVTNKMLTTFRPESFERVLVHTYLMIDFMMLDDWSSARVEAKKALRILDGLDPDLQDQSFTRYVCGLAFEVMGDTDDAYIEYSKVAQESPGFSRIYYDLYRLAILKGGSDTDKWAKEITERGGALPTEMKAPNLIIFVGAGRSPRKKEINAIVPPYANRFVLPDYVSSGSLAGNAVLKINNGIMVPSRMLTDLDPLAEKTLKKRMGKEIAEEAARVAAKAAIAKQLENQNTLLGLGAQLVFFASEAADVRSWETLPRYLGVITHSLPPGTYDLSVDFYSSGGTSLGTVEQKGVAIAENRRTVLSVRSVQ